LSCNTNNYQLTTNNLYFCSSNKQQPLNRIDRLSAILIHLQSKRRVTAQEIAERFEISLRSVYRDVKALQESGVPIIGESGIGYSVMEGYRLPPVMFTNEEASSLLLAGKLAEVSTDPVVKKHFENALYKIKSVLRYTDKEQIETLEENVIVLPSSYNTSKDANAQYLSELQRAMVTKKVVHMVYCKAYDTTAEARDVEPIGLCYYGNAWHCIAWCRLRNDYRDFKMSRIVKLYVTETIFDNSSHPSISEYLSKMTARETQLSEIVIRIRKDVARYIGEQKFYYGFVSEEICDNDVRLRFLTSYPDMFARWILMFADALTIESPTEFKEQVKVICEKLYRHHV